MGVITSISFERSCIDRSPMAFVYRDNGRDGRVRRGYHLSERKSVRLRRLLGCVRTGRSSFSVDRGRALDCLRSLGE